MLSHATKNTFAWHQDSQWSVCVMGRAGWLLVGEAFPLLRSDCLHFEQFLGIANIIPAGEHILAIYKLPTPYHIVP